MGLHADNNVVKLVRKLGKFGPLGFIQAYLGSSTRKGLDFFPFQFIYGLFWDLQPEKFQTLSDFGGKNSTIGV